MRGGTSGLVVVTVWAAWGVGLPEAAGRCLPPRPLAEVFAQADVAFLGEVTTWVTDPESHSVYVALTVIEAWKGIAGREVGVWASIGTSVSARPVVGAQWLIVTGTAPDDRIWVDQCNIRPSSEAEMFAVLGVEPLVLTDGPDPLYPPPVDCNDNGLFDTFDAESGESADCNLNSLPDECDIDTGDSFDLNANGVPDECDQGDADGDGDVDLADYLAFTACFGATDQEPDFPPCVVFDSDRDGDVDLADLLAMQAAFTGSRLGL